MKLQKFIIEISIDDFRRKLSQALSDGWKVIPNTLSTVLSTTPVTGTSVNGDTVVARSYLCSVLLEKN